MTNLEGNEPGAPTDGEEPAAASRVWLSDNGRVVEVENLTRDTAFSTPNAIVLVVRLPQQVDFFIAAGDGVVKGARAPWQAEVGQGGELYVRHEADGEPRVIRIYAAHAWETLTTSTERE